MIEYGSESKLCVCAGTKETERERGRGKVLCIWGREYGSVWDSERLKVCVTKRGDVCLYADVCTKNSQCLCVSACKYVYVRESQTETETERKRERKSEREKEIERGRNNFCVTAKDNECVC